MNGNEAFALALKKSKEFAVTGIEKIEEVSYNSVTGESVLRFTYKTNSGTIQTTNYTIKGGKAGTNVVEAKFAGDDIVFTLSDATLVTIPNGKKDLKGEKGENGKGAQKGGVAGQVLAKRSDIDFDTEWVNQSDVTKEYVDEELTKRLSKTDDIKPLAEWNKSQAQRQVASLYEVGKTVVDLNSSIDNAFTEMERLEETIGAVLTTEVTLTSATQNTDGHYVKFKAENGDVYYSEEINKLRETGVSTFTFKIKIQPDLYGHLEIIDNSGTLFKSVPFITQSGRNDYAFFCDYNTKTYIFDGVSQQGTLEAIKANAGSTTSSHNKLSDLQGGKADSEYYHISKAESGMVKAQLEGVFSGSKFVTEDIQKNKLNLVSTSDFGLLFGNRTHESTFFSPNRKDLTHEYNEGYIYLVETTDKIDKMTPKKYTTELPSMSYNKGQLCITKAYVHTENGEELGVPSKGEIRILQNGALKGTINKFVDSITKKTTGKLLIDIQSKIVLEKGMPITVEFTTEVDSKFLGRLDVIPRVEFTIEYLRQKTIADLEDIIQAVPNAVLDESLYDYDVIADGISIAYIKMADATKLNSNRNIVLPEMIEDLPVIRITGPIPTFNGYTKVIGNTIELIEDYGEMNGSFCQSSDTVQEIHLPRLKVMETGITSLVKDCKILKALHIYDLERFDDKIVDNCPMVTIYTKSSNSKVISYCLANSIPVVAVDAPAIPKDTANKYLGLKPDGTLGWLTVEGVSEKHPYITLTNVTTNITNATKKDDIFSVDISATNVEFVRNPLIVLDFGLYSYTAELTNVASAWTFKFPFNASDFKAGEKVAYSLAWRNSNGLVYQGFETVIKNIIV